MAKTDEQKTQLAINLNLDTTPIFYTDNIFISVNEDGVVLDVGQKIASSKNIRIVARIGMSRNHAKKFLQKFGNLFALTEGKDQTGTKVKN